MPSIAAARPLDGVGFHCFACSPPAVERVDVLPSDELLSFLVYTVVRHAEERQEKTLSFQWERQGVKLHDFFSAQSLFLLQPSRRNADPACFAG
eukprot:1073333-Rhodomonas_salina.1